MTIVYKSKSEVEQTKIVGTIHELERVSIQLRNEGFRIVNVIWTSTNGCYVIG